MNKLKVLNSNLQVNKISKSFGNKQVVRNISLNINRGEIVGLLGPNGAGKTTTFNLVIGLLRPDSGQVLLDFESKFPEGSSANITSGFDALALAAATLCCCPPDSSFGL